MTLFFVTTQPIRTMTAKKTTTNKTARKVTRPSKDRMIRVAATRPFFEASTGRVAQGEIVELPASRAKALGGIVRKA